ncbi:hypothetical protein GCM10022224_051460 [Nonomuraea antimicrobica]|uniref:Uncharacterized protein n=1 Tax=Nonomuraea antimicrobica TaxID=561173 RepID=A0ABP7C5V5_9ACTN
MLPVRTGTPYLPWHDPREATRLLRYASPRVRSTHTYQSMSNGASAQSVLTELTVWCDDGSFIANEEGDAPVTRPIDDPVGTARRIAARNRQQGPSRPPIDSVGEPTV